MFRTITNKNPIYAELSKVDIKLYARLFIHHYRMGADELMLETLLLERYGLGLKLMCIKLINMSQVTFTSRKELVLRWADKELDETARLITYGNGKIIGSQILNKAIDWAKERLDGN